MSTPSHASAASGRPAVGQETPEADLTGHTDLDDLAGRAGIGARHVIPYGRDVAKIALNVLADDGPAAAPGEEAHYIVVTGITPTPAGEGKTTTAIGLAQGLALRRRRPVLTLRQSADRKSVV